MNITEEESLLRARAKDLVTLAKYRSENNIFMDTKQKISFFFIYMVTIVYMEIEESKKELDNIAEVLKLNRPYYVERCKRQVFGHNKYYYHNGTAKFKYKTQTIISLLNITEEEMQKLNLHILVSEKVLDSRFKTECEDFE